MGPWQQNRLALATLLLLTFVAGGVDATTFLFVGGTFVSNQTGTVLLLAMNAAGAQAVNTGAALISIVGFFGGAALSGRAIPKMAAGEEWPQRIRLLLWLEVVMIVISGVFISIVDVHEAWTVAPLGIAMGAQATLAKRIAMPFLTTGYITGALTTGSMTSPLGDRASSWWWYASIPILFIALGAATMAMVAKQSVITAVGILTAVMVVAALIPTFDQRRSASRQTRSAS